MNALNIGLLIILFLFLSNITAAYVVSQTTPIPTIPSCDSGDNITTCNDIGEAGIFSTFATVSVSGIPGAPTQFNQVWVFINVFLLILAILLMATFFIGLPFGGSG